MEQLNLAHVLKQVCLCEFTYWEAAWHSE